MNDVWNPWHGCIKYSEGCKNCYVYRRDESIGKDASKVYKTASFDLPLKKDRNGNYKIKDGSTIFCCKTSDFFLDLADCWRNEIWEIIRTRSGVNFVVITKRIERFMDCIPDDWGEGYSNFSIASTVENQKQCDIRLPILLKIPCKNISIACEPLLEKIDLERYLDSSISQIVAGGESGNDARPCNYDWILSLRNQCKNKGVGFYFKQTGKYFIKDGVMYDVERKFQHSQAKKANINTVER